MDAQDCDDDNEHILLVPKKFVMGWTTTVMKQPMEIIFIDAILIFEDLDGDGDGNIERFQLACDVEDEPRTTATVMTKRNSKTVKVMKLATT